VDYHSFELLKKLWEVPDFRKMGSKELLHVKGCEYKDQISIATEFMNVRQNGEICINVLGDQLAVNDYV
jgi:hypothetical protein